MEAKLGELLLLGQKKRLMGGNEKGTFGGMFLNQLSLKLKLKFNDDDIAAVR